MNIRKNIVRLALSAVMSVSVLSSLGCKDRGTDDSSPKATTENITTTEFVTEEPATEEPTTKPYLGPSVLNFYQSDRAAGCRRLVTEFKGPWTVGKDILSIDVFASDEATISGKTFSGVWKEYWEKYQEAYNYKIGYVLEFDTASEGKIKRTILEPDDIYGFLDYIEVYIYDDVNVPPNTWYSHLLQEQITDKTYVTSIKLTCGKRIDEVSNISLTAFAYNKDKSEFDSNGNYTGQHTVKCPVYKN